MFQTYSPDHVDKLPRFMEKWEGRMATFYANQLKKHDIDEVSFFPAAAAEETPPPPAVAPASAPIAPQTSNGAQPGLEADAVQAPPPPPDEPEPADAEQAVSGARLSEVVRDYAKVLLDAAETVVRPSATKGKLDRLTRGRLNRREPGELMRRRGIHSTGCNRSWACPDKRVIGKKRFCRSRFRRNRPRRSQR
jgi:hypothetical protein